MRSGIWDNGSRRRVSWRTQMGTNWGTQTQLPEGHWVMLSIRLVQLIETHWEEIAARLIREVKRHPDTSHLANRPESELRAWCREILENLGYLLAARQEAEVERRFRLLGRMRFEENIPLHEAVLRLQFLKGEIV